MLKTLLVFCHSHSSYTSHWHLSEHCPVIVCESQLTVVDRFCSCDILCVLQCANIFSLLLCLYCSCQFLNRDLLDLDLFSSTPWWHQRWIQTFQHRSQIILSKHNRTKLYSSNFAWPCCTLGPRPRWCHQHVSLLPNSCVNLTTILFESCFSSTSRNTTTDLILERFYWVGPISISFGQFNR